MTVVGTAPHSAEVGDPHTDGLLSGVRQPARHHGRYVVVEVTLLSASGVVDGSRSWSSRSPS